MPLNRMKWIPWHIRAFVYAYSCCPAPQTVLGICVLYVTFAALFVGGASSIAEADIPLLLVGYGFGASFVALFAQARPSAIPPAVAAAHVALAGHVGA
jgi:hypothetical protein